MIIYTATDQEWRNIKEQTEFVSDSFDTEGFIHCSYPNQTVWVLNKHFKGHEKVMLLCIDPKRLKVKWISEDLKGRGEAFPHVYGKINKDAIVEVFSIHPANDGLFYENKALSRVIEAGAVE